MIRKFNTLLAEIEARVLRQKAFKLFRELNFDEGWQTNFATGAGSYAELDLYVLYKIIISLKPQKVLELGSGKSTIAMTHFLNSLNYPYDFYSMDEYEKWGNLTKRYLEDVPNNHNTKVIISERKQSKFQFFNGTCYTRVPDDNFNFIFVDGPDPEGGINTDVCEILSRQEERCNVLVDGRYRTVLAIEAAFPAAKSFRFINNMTLFRGLCAREFRENNFSHIHYRRSSRLDRILPSVKSLVHV